MSRQLTSYQPSNKTDLELYGDLFMVPADWKSCGPVIHINGAPGIPEGQPFALALTKKDLSLCSPEGPIWSLPIGAVKAVSVEELKGISFPVNTPSGITQMVPPIAYGLIIGFLLTPSGVQSELTLYTLTPAAARGWKQDILTAVHTHSLGQSQGPDRR